MQLSLQEFSVLEKMEQRIESYREYSPIDPKFLEPLKEIVITVFNTDHGP